MIGKNQEKGNKKSMVVTLIKKPEQDFRLRFLKKNLHHKTRRQTKQEC